MSALVLSGDMPNCVLGLEDRNRAAHKVITSYAQKHAAMDVGIGIAGLIPIPGAATVALIGAIAAQAPVIYEPMAREIASIYNSTLDAQTRRIVTETVEMGALADVGIEFLKEIATEIISEVAAGTLLTAIPFVGGIAAALLDATIAATLTWRVGTMVAAYYQNGGTWIQNRKHTYELAAKAVDGFSPKTDNRTNLNDFARRNKTISEKHLNFAMAMVEMMKSAALSRNQIRSALEAKLVPSWLIAQALDRAFGV
jgi:uncharacterized protein (DUF697 family)